VSLREGLLIIHILGVVAMAFGSGAGLISAIAAGSKADVATIASSARVALLGGRVTTFAALLVLVVGTWLVLDNDTFDFEQTWLSVSYVLWIVAMGIGGGLMARDGRRVLKAAEAALERGEVENAAVRDAWNAPTTKIAGGALLLLYVVFVYLMVAKPGL
jgi:uncharacterized membrane protein